MNKRLLPTLSIILGIAGLAAVVDEAAADLTNFQERDFATAGDGLLSFDRVTNREWLDLTESVNRSFAEMTDGGGLHNCNPTCTMGPYQGFTFAPLVDITAVFVNARFPGLGQTGARLDTPLGQEIAQFIDFFGNTGASRGPTVFRTGGLGNDPSGGFTSLAFADLNTAANQARTAVGLNRLQTVSDDLNGIWLYRGAAPAPIPIPAALVLFPFALASLGVLARRRKLLVFD